MIPEPGSNRISYSELSQDPKGLRLWESYMRQVTEIGLQRSEHFYPRTARVIIPEDAKRHRLYVYVGDHAVIDAFCVATVSCGQAELLWANCRKGRARSMMKLYDFIEQDMFEGEYPVSKITGMTCTEDTLITDENGNQIDGKAWSPSHRFHESRGYRFTHRLEDFWEEGSHAFVFMKSREQYLLPREPHRYGYSRRNRYVYKPAVRKRTEDENRDLNKQIYKQIWHYLDVFDETFVKSFPPEEKKSFVADSRMKGFTGLILANSVKRIATIFATTSAEPDLDAETILKFEYDIDASALTQMLLSDEIHDDVGILHYEAEWDTESEISVATYCERLFPSLLEDGLYRERGFTVFYARRPGVNGCTSVVYFVTADIENVVWYKPLWKAFARYSFALVLEIYSYFSSLLVLESCLRKNDYFKSLIDAVSPAPVSGSDDDFLSKIARMKNAIQKRINAHHSAVVDARKREMQAAGRLAEARKVALSHYGHTLKHRLDVLSAFLDANGPGAVRLRADMLKDLTLILQLNSVDDRPELCEKLPERKRKRFLDIEGVDDAIAELDLLGRIHVWADVLTRYEDVPVKDASGQVEKHVHCPVGLKLYDRISSATIGWQMTSMGQRARLKEPVFRELLFELLNNAWKYGDRRLRTVDGTAQVQISVWLDTVPMIIDGETRPLLVLANVIQPAKVDDCPLIAQTWSRWPDKGDIRYNGPGMALDLFRRLDLGDMYYRTRTRKGRLYLEVGISFAALAVNAGVAKEQAND